MLRRRIKDRRRPVLFNYTIKTRMQLRLLFKIMFIALLAAGINSIFFYFFSNQEIGQSLRQFHINAKTFVDFLIPGILIAFTISIVITFIISIFSPHRIAGPIYRIEKIVREEIGEGNLNTTFRLRKGDEFEDLANALNRMVDKLKMKIEHIRNLTDELSQTDLDDKVKLKELIESLEEKVREFKL